MLKKVIEYKDFDGNKTSGTFYFNLTEAELTKFKLELGEDIGKRIKVMMAKNNAKGVIDLFDRLLELSYLVRVGEGISKHPSHFEQFVSTDAYSVIFMELIGDPSKTNEFIRGILPTELAEKMPVSMTLDEALEKIQAEETPGLGGGKPPAEVEPAKKKFEDYTEAELMSMTWAEFHEIVGKDIVSWPQAVMVMATQRKVAGK